MDKYVDIYSIEQNDIITRGAMTIDFEAFCVTQENSWRNNEPYVSCILIAR